MRRNNRGRIVTHHQCDRGKDARFDKYGNPDRYADEQNLFPSSELYFPPLIEQLEFAERAVFPSDSIGDEKNEPIGDCSRITRTDTTEFRKAPVPVNQEIVRKNRERR